MEIVTLCLSAAHVYAGHFGRPAGTTPMLIRDQLRVEAGRGIDGDRYCQAPGGHEGQVTFFAEETWLRLRQTLGRLDAGPEVFRRNVVVRGADLCALIGQEFEIQGVRFQGAAYCKPCFWMDQAFAPGTLAALTAWQAGGLRARALSSGRLAVAGEFARCSA
jgi:MOSC domain-containing protein YiiM